MSNPINLTNFRDITGGEPTIESALFEEFYTSSERCLMQLEQAYQDNSADLWRASAHALKGMALTLGAGRLGELCKYAQEHTMADQAEKQQMIHSITIEYELVKKFLKTSS